MYGPSSRIVLPDDEELRARLNNIPYVEHAVLMQMVNLLRPVTIMRDQTNCWPQGQDERDSE